MARSTSPRWLRWLSGLGVIALITGTAAIVWAQPPEPNPLTPGNPMYSAAAAAAAFKPGPAASIHGDPVAGRALYTKECESCHGPRGTGGVPNPDSDDEVVPELNPIDPEFVENSSGDPAAFASALDVFLQHGSIPAGDEPELYMLPFGDRKILTQQQIADIEAYVMQLNGLYWPDRWAPPMEIQKTATQSGDKITYEITMINHSFAALTNVTLRDTLPAGMTYLDSYRDSSGLSSGSWSGSTVSWQTGTDVPAGGTTGPFTIVAQTSGAAVLPDVAQALFNWSDWKGDTYATSAVSAPAVPVNPTPALAPAAARVTAPKPAATAVAKPAPTAAAAAPTAAGDAKLGQQIYDSSGCSACHVINGTGGLVGPELTHIASQPYDALPNTADFLAKWLADPQAQKPGATMPKPNLTAAQIDAVVAYLMTLK